MSEEKNSIDLTEEEIAKINPEDILDGIPVNPDSDVEPQTVLVICKRCGARYSVPPRAKYVRCPRKQPTCGHIQILI